jgi:hypothetical protein
VEALEQIGLFAAMVISGSSRDICPNLTSFVYGIREEFAYNAFFAMVGSRFRASDPYSGLTHLRVFDPFSSVDYNDLAIRIKRLRDEGLDAAVLSTDEVRPLMAEGFFA